jgi:hypothetical protein
VCCLISCLQASNCLAGACCARAPRHAAACCAPSTPLPAVIGIGTMKFKFTVFDQGIFECVPIVPSLHSPAQKLYNSTHTDHKAISNSIDCLPRAVGVISSTRPSTVTLLTPFLEITSAHEHVHTQSPHTMYHTSTVLLQLVSPPTLLQPGTQQLLQPD